MTDRFARFLEASLDLLADEVPELSRGLGAHLAGRALAVEVDGHGFTVVSDGARARIAPDAPAEARVCTRSEVVHALLDGRLRLLDALRADALELVGSVRSLVHLDRALFLYLSAAVRSPGHPALLARWRAGEGGG